MTQGIPGQAGSSINGAQAVSVDLDHGQVVVEDVRATTIVPDTGKTSVDLAKSWEAERMARATAVELPEAPERGAADEETATEAPAAGETVDAGALPAKAPTAKDAKTSTAGAPEDPDRLARIERAAAAGKKASAEARRTRERYATAEQQRVQALQRAQAIERENTELRAIRDGIRREPLDAIKQTTGLTIQQLTEMAMKEGSPEAKLEALAKALEATQKENEAIRNSIKQEKETAARTAAETRNEEVFMRAATAKVKLAGATEATPRYPELVGIDRPTLVAMAIGVARQTMTRYQKQGLPYVQPTDRQILEHLNDSLGKRTKGSPTEQKKTAPAAATTKAETATGTRKASPAPRAVTNSMSKGVLKSSADLSALPREKRIAEMVRRGMI